jgi:hypothetical protein
MKVKSHWDFNASKENNLRLGLCYIHIHIDIFFSCHFVRFAFSLSKHTLFFFFLVKLKFHYFQIIIFFIPEHCISILFYFLISTSVYFWSLSTNLSVCIWLANDIFCFSDLILYIHVGKLCLFLCLYVTNTFSFSFFYLCES